MPWTAFLRVFLVWSFWLYLPSAVIVIAADEVREGLPKEPILDPTAFDSVAQLLERDGYRLDSEHNRTSAEFFSSKHPSDMLLTSGQYHKSGSDQGNDSATRGLSLRRTVRFNSILTNQGFPDQRSPRFSSRTKTNKGREGWVKIQRIILF
jgi:hypothetical protein